MTTPTVRVFVSSTSLDLQPERAAVKEAVLRMRELQFSGMEHFGSRDQTTAQASLDEVDASGLYVGIFAARYGSGITGQEYRRARRLRLPCFAYFKDESTIAPEWRETDPEQTAKLNALKHELRANHIAAPDFLNPHDLAAKVTADLHRWLFDEHLKPQLEAALRGEVSHAAAQVLLDGIKSARDLGEGLLERLRGAGFNVAAGERSAAIGGSVSDSVISTGDSDVVVGSARGDVVRGDKIVYETPALSISALHQMPPPPRDFTGRERELAELTEQIERGGATISDLHGLGGIGKTALALKLAERLKGRYSDAQFYLNLQGVSAKPLTAAEALAHVVRAYHPTARLPESEADLRALYLSVLHDKRALLLMDNAADRNQVEPLIPPDGCALLVTSRQHFTLPGLFAKNLDALSPVESRELLLKIAPRIPSDIADHVCYLCGYLPLALRAAASLLDITADLDPADYAAQLRDERTRLQHIGTEGVDIDVEASISLSYNRLSPDAARVFRLLSVFPDTFDAQAEEAVCEDPHHKHLSDLLRRNLVLYNPDTHRYRLHDLTRLFASARMTEDEQNAAQTRHAVHYVSVLWETDGLYKQGGETVKRGLAVLNLEWRNIQAGQLWAEKWSGENDTAASLCMDYPNAGAYTLTLRQHPRDNIFWQETALAAARRLKNREAEASHLTHLGMAYADLGKTRRAIEFYEQALIICHETKNQRQEANALGNLGNAYFLLGEVRRAVEFYEQALAIMREIGERRGEGAALGSLGNAYTNLGEVRRAIEFYEQRLTLAREIGDRLGEGNALVNLGIAYNNLGEVRRAIELFERQLIITREIGDRRGEAIALFNAGLALDKLGDRAQAMAHAEAALEIFEQLESPNVEVVREQIAAWRGQG